MQNKISEYKKFFKGKSITVMGLGLLGRGVGDVAFLAECGAKLIVTDLKPSTMLRPSLQKLRKHKNIKYVLGKHRLEDFRNRDLILKSAGVPLDSIYIKEARKNKIPIEMSAALFAKLSRLTMVGVTGTRGKSTVTHLIAHILKSAGKKLILGGNVRGVSNLQLLKKVKDSELAVFELDSWQLQGFAENKISPHIAVFTNFLSDHLNYYQGDRKRYFQDKSYIYKFQKKGDFLVLGPGLQGIKNTKSRIVKSNVSNILKSSNLPGQHNLENIACAVAMARILKIKESVIVGAIKSFETLPGRLELVREIRGVKIYNDTNSTTPDAILAALAALQKNTILILGGMDKGLDVSKLTKVLSRTRAVFLTPGSGSERIKYKNAIRVPDLKTAVWRAMKQAMRGDAVLFSPGFASFNMFKNEYDRGDQFVKLVKRLK